MADKIQEAENLNPQELDAIYAISRVVTRASELDASLDEIIGIARTVFIFDNVVLYVHHQTESIEPSYARAIGRGRNSETDLAWGEPIAREVLKSGEIVLRQEITGDFTKDRMKDRYFLGFPLIAGDQQIGALVFVRYGGPQFTPEHTHLAEYIAGHIAQLYEHGNLVTQLSRLEAERQLERLQDDFVATVSHELRTPLGFIKGYATSLLRDDANWDEETRREFLMIIDEETDRLKELIDNLLDSSRLQSGTLRMEFQPLRIDTMLKDLTLRAKSFHADLDIQVNLITAPLKIEADPTRLAQVFDNLISNAIKYAPNSTVDITLDTEDGYAHIKFSDQGPGIPDEALPNIFTRFYRVPNQNRSVRGTGLGLFICRQIVTAHRGQIIAVSKLGEGTTFHIYLPILNHKTEEQNRES
ncbi:MAG: sensor histidine kinase [Anaerolineales bacterium]